MNKRKQKIHSTSLTINYPNAIHSWKMKNTLNTTAN